MRAFHIALLSPWPEPSPMMLEFHVRELRGPTHSSQWDMTRPIALNV